MHNKIRSNIKTRKKLQFKKNYNMKVENLKNVHYDIEQIKYKNIYNDEYENICI